MSPLNNLGQIKMIKYIVTTKTDSLNGAAAIAMVDGTVPGWKKADADLHYDHHRPEGAAIQVDEMPAIGENPILNEEADWVIVTTQVDADACVAAAWLQLTALEATPDAVRKLRAIAYDCDHLGLPQSPEWDDLREFAWNAVAALKISGDEIALDLGLPSSRKDWSEQQKEQYASRCFKDGTEWLIDAVRGNRPYPGEQGEASTYWAKVDAQRTMVNSRCRLLDGVATFDARGISEYVDPRLLVEWARMQPNHRNITLTVRDRPLKLVQCDGSLLTEFTFTARMQQEKDVAALRSIILSAYSYTLGSVPLHSEGSPKFSDRGVWKLLAQAESQKRIAINFPPPDSQWGGRNEVGGSSWNDACLLTPTEVIEVATMLSKK